MGAQIEKLPELTSMEFELPEIPTIEGNISSKKENTKTIFNGVPLELNTESDTSLIKDESCIYFRVVVNEISDKTQESRAHMRVQFKKTGSKNWEATTSVRNNYRELKGLGRALYEIVLRLIQQFANENNISITHEIARVPHFGLSIEKWNELFKDTLKNYTQTGSHWWEKEYKPEK